MHLEQVHQRKATRNISCHLLKKTRAAILFPVCVLLVLTILYYSLHQSIVLEISFENQQVEGNTDTSHLSSNKQTKRIEVNWGHLVFPSLKQSRVSVQLHQSGFCSPARGYWEVIDIFTWHSWHSQNRNSNFSYGLRLIVLYLKL